MQKKKDQNIKKDTKNTQEKSLETKELYLFQEKQIVISILIHL